MGNHQVVWKCPVSIMTNIDGVAVRSLKRNEMNNNDPYCSPQGVSGYITKTAPSNTAKIVEACSPSVSGAIDRLDSKVGACWTAVEDLISHISSVLAQNPNENSNTCGTPAPPRTPICPVYDRVDGLTDDLARLIDVIYDAKHRLRL
jgi:hypothetical protein